MRDVMWRLKIRADISKSNHSYRTVHNHPEGNNTDLIRWLGIDQTQIKHKWTGSSLEVSIRQQAVHRKEGKHSSTMSTAIF
jgi:hypothetical protein